MSDPAAPPATPLVGIPGMVFHGPPGPLLAALAAAQEEFPTIAPTRTGQTGNRKFGYGDLKAMIDATRPILTKNKLSVFSGIGSDDQGHLIITTVLGHDSGSLVSASVRLDAGDMATKDGVQWCGAITTYWRRFQYRALLFLAEGEDLDEESAPAARVERPQNGPRAQVVHFGPRAAAAATAPTAKLAVTETPKPTDEPATRDQLKRVRELATKLDKEIPPPQSKREADDLIAAMEHRVLANQDAAVERGELVKVFVQPNSPAQIHLAMGLGFAWDGAEVGYTKAVARDQVEAVQREATEKGLAPEVVA